MNPPNEYTARQRISTLRANSSVFNTSTKEERYRGSSYIFLLKSVFQCWFVKIDFFILTVKLTAVR